MLTLVEDARRVRDRTFADSTLRTYASQARGYLYFFLDRPDTGERVLVKTDQIALEVYWMAPNRTKQRIVGLRDEKSLPTNIRYHLDHLLVVQDNFPNRIRLGEGDEVAAVPHPIGPGSEEIYDYLLSDSVTLVLPTAQRRVTVYEVRVRPKDFTLPRYLGSVYLDRDTHAIARMSFTFTPASYVDPYLDEIHVSLENGLWEGRYWLPYRQELEIRREMPYLDLPAGSVIRGWFEIRDYQINPPLPPSLFLGNPVTALPDSVRRAFPFEAGLHDQLAAEEEQGLVPPPTMEEIRAVARSVAKEHYLSGLRRSRLYLPEPLFSSALRYNRAERLFLGAGLSQALSSRTKGLLYAGYSFGRRRPATQATLLAEGEKKRATVQAYLNRPRELGGFPFIAGALNTLSSLLFQEDFTDLFFSSGVTLGGRLGDASRPSLTGRLRWEHHRSAPAAALGDPPEDGFRPVLPITPGRWLSAEANASIPMPWSGASVHLEGQAGRFRDHGFGALRSTLEITEGGEGQPGQFLLQVGAGTLLGHPPPQALFLLGGRGTVPGYPFKAWAVKRYWLLRTEASLALLEPFVRVRAFAAAGGMGERPAELPAGWPNTAAPGLLLSVGAGVALGWDVLRLDLARGLRGPGEWEWLVSVRPDFLPWL